MIDRLSMSDVAVGYGAFLALDGVSLRVPAGTGWALLGENGAGKSTLLKALAGVVRLRRGEILLDGEPFLPRAPVDAWRAGIATIHQELSLPTHLSVADAIVLGAHRVRFGLVDRRARDAAAREALRLVGRAELPLHAPVRTLAPSQQQLVEIARALARNARVVVMDEPTSSLGGDDQQRLFTVVDRLRERGIAVLWVSHSLTEVRRVASHATVLRDGREVLSTRLADASDDELVRAMAGRDLSTRVEIASGTLGAEFLAARGAEFLAARGAVSLEARGLAGVGGPADATFALHHGEVLGIAGLAGAGRTELLETLFGLRAMAGGTCTFGEGSGRRSPMALWLRGSGFVAEDRKHSGLSSGQSIAANASLPLLPRLRGLLSEPRLDAAVRDGCERMRVKCTSLRQRVRELSGGNQQKVAFARLLASACSVLLLDEPTRGIDVGSRTEIHRLLRERAAAGAAVLVVSSQLPELLEVCDRVAVMRRGVLSPARAATQWTQESLLAAALPDAEGGAA